MHLYTLKISFLKGLLGLSTFFMLAQLHAQSSAVISLEEVKVRAKENNTSLKISQQDYALAKGQYESSRAVLLPQVRLSNTSTFTNNPLQAFGFPRHSLALNTVAA